MRTPLLATLVLGSYLSADVSIITQTKTEPGDLMPQFAQAMMMSAADGRARLRVNRGRSLLKYHSFDAIVEGTGITLVDRRSATFATGTMSDFVAAERARKGEIPPEIEKMFSEGGKAEVLKSDRTDVVLGIKVVERLLNVSLRMTMPPMPFPSAAPMPKDLHMNLRIHLWSPIPSEVERVPALKELVAASRSAMGLGGEQMMTNLEDLVPIGQDVIAKLVEELSAAGAYPLRTQLEVSMPEMLALMSQMGGSTSAVPSDPNATFLKMTQEVSELSTEPLNESLFQAPKDFKEISFAELLRRSSK